MQLACAQPTPLIQFVYGIGQEVELKLWLLNLIKCVKVSRIHTLTLYALIQFKSAYEMQMLL